MAGPKRIDDHYEQIRPEEREVVVSAVPDHDVGLLLRLLEDLAVVDTGVHDHPQLDGALVLLTLLDRGLGHVDVDLRREPLDAHRLEIPVGHRMPHERDTDAAFEQDLADVAARLALAGTGSDGAHGNHRLRALEHRRLRAEQPEVGSRGQGDRRLVHHRLVGDVRVGEHDLVDPELPDQRRQLLLRIDRDPCRVELARQRPGIPPLVDAGDLGGREGNDVDVRVVPVHDVEVVEVAAPAPMMMTFFIVSPLGGWS